MNSSWRRYTVVGAEILFIAAAPIAAFYAFSISLINQNNTVDAWFYTGYGQELKVFIDVFGWQYYAARFPVILLIAAAERFIDPVLGFALLRYAILLACGIPLYVWARRRFGIPFAVAAYAFLLANPLLARTILWDYTIFLSVPAALAGMALWQISDRPTFLTRAVSGFAFCVAVVSHVFTGTAIAVFFVVEAGFRLMRREYVALALLDIAAPVVGATACYAIGMACYFAIIGPFDLLAPVWSTLEAIWSGDEYALSHSRAVTDWLWENTNVLVPPFLVASIAIAFPRELLKDTVVARAWWFGFIYCAAYATYQFLFRRFVLETYYYFAHLTLVAYLLFPVYLYLIARKLPAKQQIAAVGLGLAVLICGPLVVHYTFDYSTLNKVATASRVSLTVGLPLVILIGTGRFAQKSTILTCCRAISVIAGIQILSLITPVFGSMYLGPLLREHEVYRAAVQMVRIFGQYSTSSKSVMLWYPHEEREIATSIASTVILESISDPFETAGGLPIIGDYERERLNLPEERFIMLLSYNPETIAEGKQELLKNGYLIREVTQQLIGDADFKVHLDLVEIVK